MSVFQVPISVSTLMSTSLLLSVTLLKKSIYVLLVMTSFQILDITGSVVMARAQTADIEILRIRVIAVTKGLNQEELSVGFDDTYQSKALLHLSEQVGVDNFSYAKLVQYYALYCIYHATNGVPNEITDADVRFENIVMPEWLMSANWKDVTTIDACGTTTTTTTTIVDNTTENIATTLSTSTTTSTSEGWYGVVCDDEGQVIALDLFDNILSGVFPEEIVLLASDGQYSTPGAGNLERLDLYENQFLSNRGDSSWMSDLGSNMTTILVEGTGFSGDIPLLPENLVNFNIANAFYTGGFNDDSFSFSSQLNFLNVDGNIFNTSIPSILSELPNLEFLYMSDNYLVGDLSPLEGLPAIRELWIDANPGLIGPLFSWIGSMTTLESLSLTYNNLTGSVPSELGDLVDMQQLWLLFNNLNGTIPTAIGLMKKLEILELESNSFTGFVHASICENTEFPLEILKKVGADCYDENFFCPCCTCCDLEECVTGGSRIEMRRKLNLGGMK